MSNIVPLHGSLNAQIDKLLVRVQASTLGQTESRELSEWVRHLVMIRNYSLRTVALYRDALIELWQWMQTTDYDAINVESVEGWLKHLALERRNESSTRTLKLTAVRQLCAWREYHGAGPNPLRGLPGARRKRRMAQKFSTEQLQKLFAVFDRSTPIGLRDYAMLSLMYATGARRQEIILLNLDQLELRKHYGAVRFFGKGAKERVITFEGPIVGVLYDWLAMRERIGTSRDRNAVFIATSHPNKGGRLSAASITDIFNRAARKAGLRTATAWPHKMRATFCTDIYDSGVDLEVIRHLMGHEDIRTTERYLAITDKRMQARMPAARQHELLNSKIMKLPGYARQKVTARQGDDELS